MFPRWQCAPLRLWCPAQWLVRSCFNPYVFFSILAVRRGDMWRGSFMKARFVHRVEVFEMSSSWRPEWNKEQKEHSHIGEEKERKRVGVGGGGMHDRLCGWGESWELLNGLCEIYSNFFKYRPASSPPTLSTKGSDFHTRGVWACSAAREKTDDDCWWCFGGIQHPSPGKILESLSGFHHWSGTQWWSKDVQDQT